MMEQLPDTIRDMQRGGVSRLDFYEQGIEKCLKFVPEGEAGMIIEIDSLVPSAEAVGTKISASRDDVVQILCQVGKTFLGAAKRCCPKTASHPWFIEWSCDLEQQIFDIMH
ncbi:hypothetical protein [Sorangium sp. So ce1078]|uniref:hypothetical protein n=1 Tax=Sorangium sp. So ce1078 TaxID=3133329 RepID=UPI003F5FD63D